MSSDSAVILPLFTDAADPPRIVRVRSCAMAGTRTPVAPQYASYQQDPAPAQPGPTLVLDIDSDRSSEHDDHDPPLHALLQSDFASAWLNIEHNVLSLTSKVLRRVMC